MHAVWGAGQMAWTKYIVVVDEEVDVHDEGAVWQAVFDHCDFARDLELVNGPLDILDHAAPRLGAGHKLGIDATRKLPGDDVNGVPVAAPPPGGTGRCAFTHGVDAIEKAWADGADFVIAVGDHVDLADEDAVLFHWCANSDPGRDLLRRGSKIAFDATPKEPGEGRGGHPVRDFPPLVEMSEEIRDRVTKRWTEYGLD
jgi:4-hydroxy-3-polyprenylbenzoate decarboxylase